MQTRAEWNYTLDNNPVEPGIWQNTQVADTQFYSNDWLLNLARLLQTSLKVEQLIEVFATECQTAIRYNSLAFSNEKFGFSYSHGEPARHTCNYTLVLSRENLGELTFTRNQPFAEEETRRLEFLSSHLVYPLRNALMYHLALLTASKDPLTGVNNRSTLDAVLEREICLSRRHATPLAVVMLDLDHFKKVNDTYGHISGDCVLKSFVNAVNGVVRHSDEVFRYGGEEFTILLRNTDLDGATQLAERIRKDVETMEVNCNGITIKTTVSLGVASLENEDSVQELQRRVDKALYLSKANGRNQVSAAV